MEEFSYLLQDLDQIRGITKDRSLKIKNLVGGDRVSNLLLHIPNYYLTRDLIKILYPDLAGRHVAVKLMVLDYERAFKKSLPHRVTCKTQSGQIVTVSFFNFNFHFLQKLLVIGKEKIICGKLQKFKNGYGFANPDHILSDSQYDKLKIEPIYPLCSGINNKYLAKIIDDLLNNLPDFSEWITGQIKEQERLPDFVTCLKKIHQPENNEDLLGLDSYKRRLAYDELLLHQFSLQRMRALNDDNKGEMHNFAGDLLKKLREKLPFPLTSCQDEALSLLAKKQKSSEHMYHLLQGDVGSGKTMVALGAMLNVVEAGKQAALMVPTALLAEQHFKTIAEYMEDLGVRVILLTGGLTAKEKRERKKLIETNQVDIVIGTHALFYESVIFHDLGLVVIDEQHRFGVKQRARLLEKGKATDLLLMSATPIPRTLALTLYGDMEVVFLQHKPQGRKPIKTAVVSNQKFQHILASLKEAIAAGEKAYWICPLVTESELMDLAACEKRFDEFKTYFGTENVGLMHGQMTDKEKDQVMQDFYQSKIKLLVATTVIEVGINVPDATIIVIEQAERFGLAQLHQLRGRVGRSDLESKCLLLYDQEKISNFAKRKLTALRDSEDGFYLAEEDLKIRGAGDIVGTKQSGLPEFKFADLARDLNLLKIAQKEIKLLFNQDPELASEKANIYQRLQEAFGLGQVGRG